MTGPEPRDRIHDWPSEMRRPEGVEEQSMQIVDMLEAVQRPQVARLQTEVARLTAERETYRAAYAKLAAERFAELRPVQAALDAALAEAAELRAALEHRCVVQEVDAENCDDCRRIAACLEARPIGERGAAVIAAGDAMARGIEHWGGLRVGEAQARSVY